MNANINSISSFIISILLIIFPNYILKYFIKDDPKKFYNYYVGLNIFAFFIINPWVMQMFPDSYTLTSQICFSVLVLVLDWLSLYEDKTRFSEENYCIFGNCRNNAMITGIIAHLADTIGLALSIYMILNESNNIIKNNGKIILLLSTLLWSIFGIIVIVKFTMKGSESDLRGLSDDEKCKRNRIMIDLHRGVLNLVITFFGVFIGWQGVMELGNPKSVGEYSHISIAWIEEIWKFLKYIIGNNNLNSVKNTSALVRMAKGMFVILVAIIPTYTNHVNTSFQYYAPVEDLKLPKCFD